MPENIFQKRLNQLGIGRQVTAAMVVAQAEKSILEALGQRGADNLRVVSYKKGILKIASSSSAWSAECQGNINKIVKPPVERVIFVVGNPHDQDNS